VRCSSIRGIRPGTVFEGMAVEETDKK
jgi:hypothetical protein